MRGRNKRLNMLEEHSEKKDGQKGGLRLGSAMFVGSISPVLLGTCGSFPSEDTKSNKISCTLKYCHPPPRGSPFLSFPLSLSSLFFLLPLSFPPAQPYAYSFLLNFQFLNKILWSLDLQSLSTWVFLYITYVLLCCFCKLFYGCAFCLPLIPMS